MKNRSSLIIAASCAVVACNTPSVEDYSAYIDDCVRAELASINYIFDESNGKVDENAILLGEILNSLGYQGFAELGNTKVDYSYNLGPAVVKYHKELGMSYGDAISRFLPYTTSPYKTNADKLLKIYNGLDVELQGFEQTGDAEWTFSEANSGVSFIFGIQNSGKEPSLYFKADESSLEKYIELYCRSTRL